MSVADARVGARCRAIAARERPPMDFPSRDSNLWAAGYNKALDDCLAALILDDVDVDEDAP